MGLNAGWGRGGLAAALVLAACLGQAGANSAEALNAMEGCVLLQAQGFREFSMTWGYFRLQSGFVLKNHGWVQPGAQGMTIFKMSDGYWYMGRNVPIKEDMFLDRDAVVAYSSAEAGGRAPDPDATLVKPPTLPPDDRWYVKKASGDVRENLASFMCICMHDLKECGTTSMVSIFAATSVGICGWVCCLGCVLVGYKRYRGHLGFGHMPAPLDGDIEQGLSGTSPFESTSAAGRARAAPKITPKERAQHALNIISTADEGLLWVGYSKPGHGVRPGQERFAALKWLKTLDVRERKDKEAKEGAEDGDGLCCVCLDNAAACKLMPCEHAQFCAPCIIENACRWCSRDAPECPICRTPFNTIILPPASRDPNSYQMDQPAGPSPTRAQPEVVLSSHGDAPLMTTGEPRTAHAGGHGPPLGYEVPVGGGGVAYSLAPRRQESVGSVDQAVIPRDLFPPTPDQGVRGDIVLFNSDALEAVTTGSSSSSGGSPHAPASTSRESSGHGTTTQGVVVPLSVPLTVVTPSSAAHVSQAQAPAPAGQSAAPSDQSAGVVGSHVAL